MKNITDTSNVDLVINTNDLLKKCCSRKMFSWMARPSLPMIEAFRTGCRLGGYRGVINCAKNNKIPIIVNGGSPFEAVPYRQNLMKINSRGGVFSLALGYLSQVIKNPRWVMNYNYLDTQIKEFVYYFYYSKILRSSNILGIRPFYEYVRWNEQIITSTITTELKWQKYSNVVSSWRSDCQIALLKLYVYKNVLGFNDKLDHLSHLIRGGQLNRKDLSAPQGVDPVGG